jgi:hypothetical protein
MFGNCLFLSLSLSLSFSACVCVPRSVGINVLGYRCRITKCNSGTNHFTSNHCAVLDFWRILYQFRMCAYDYWLVIVCYK